MRRLLPWIGPTIWSAGLLSIAIFVDQEDFLSLIILYAATFTGYLLMIRPGGLTQNQLYAISVLGRVLLIGFIPNLSDDIYRFIWDGELVNMGVNPFQYKPSEVPANIMSTMTAGLYENLNSPDYYSIYPFVCQYLFAIGAWLANGSTLIFKIVLGSIFLLSDLMIMLLLRKILALLHLGSRSMFWYALNPLILIELHLNLHFELIMLFFVAMGIYFLSNRELWLGAIGIGLAISTKLIPLLALPFIQKHLGWRKGTGFIAICILVFLAGFLPFFSHELPGHYSESLDLYFRRFEYNASIYYLVRWVGLQIEGYNIISITGPLLSAIALIVILWLWLRQKAPISFIKLLSVFSIAITVYLFFATTVHPWYLALPVFLLPFTRHKYVLAWSGLIMLSYAGYIFDPVRELTWLLMVEYVVVAYFIGRELTIDNSQL